MGVMDSKAPIGYRDTYEDIRAILHEMGHRDVSFHQEKDPWGRFDRLSVVYRFQIRVLNPYDYPLVKRLEVPLWLRQSILDVPATRVIAVCELGSVYDPSLHWRYCDTDVTSHMRTVRCLVSKNIEVFGPAYGPPVRVVEEDVQRVLRGRQESQGPDSRLPGRRVSMPEFEVMSNPTIPLDDIRNRTVSMSTFFEPSFVRTTQPLTSSVLRGLMQDVLNAPLTPSIVLPPLDALAVPSTMPRRSPMTLAEWEDIRRRLGLPESHPIPSYVQAATPIQGEPSDIISVTNIDDYQDDLNAFDWFLQRPPSLLDLLDEVSDIG